MNPFNSEFSKNVAEQNRETHINMTSRNAKALLEMVDSRIRSLTEMRNKKTRAIRYLERKEEDFEEDAKDAEQDMKGLMEWMKNVPDENYRKKLRNQFENSQKRMEDLELEIEEVKEKIEHKMVERQVEQQYLNTLFERKKELEALRVREETTPIGNLGDIPDVALREVLKHATHDTLQAFESLSRDAREAVRRRRRDRELAPVEVIVELKRERGIKKVSIAPIHFDRVLGDGSYTESSDRNNTTWALEKDLGRRDVALFIRGRTLEDDDVDQIVRLIQKRKVCGLRIQGRSHTELRDPFSRLIRTLKIKRVTLEKCLEIPLGGHCLEGVTHLKTVETMRETNTARDINFLKHNKDLAVVNIRVQVQRASDIEQMILEWREKTRAIEHWIVQGPIFGNILNDEFRRASRTRQGAVVDDDGKTLKVQMFELTNVLIITEN